MKMFVALLMALLLSACLTRNEAQAPIASYDFSPVAMQGNGALPKVNVVLPAWQNTQTMQYRLAYRDSNQLHEYAYARWAGAPAALAEQRLRLRLAGAMVDDGRCRLRVRLQEFAQSFSSPEQSVGDLRAEVQMLDAQRRILARRLISQTAPAPSADARGGVAALAATIDQLAIGVGAWIKEDQRLLPCKASS